VLRTEQFQKLLKKHDSIRGFFPPIRDPFIGGGREGEDCADTCHGRQCGVFR